MNVALAVLLFLCVPVAALAPLGLAWAAPLILLLLLFAQRETLLRKRVFTSLWFRLLVGFAVFATISLFWTVTPASAAARAGIILPVILLGAWSGVILSDRASTLDSVPARAWIAGQTLGLALMLIELLFDQPLRALVGAPVNEMSILRLNRSAVAFACFLWPTLILLTQENRFRTAAAISFATIAAVFLSHSQSAQLGLIAGGVFLAIAFWRERFARGLIASLPILLALVMVPLAQVLRWFDIELANHLPLSFRQRIEIWDFTARRVGEHLWFGHGLDSSRHIDNAGEVSAFQAAGNPILPLHPHNAFLQLWLELGLVGATLGVLALAGAILAFGRAAAPTRPYLLAAAAAAIAMLAVAYGLWQGWWIGALVLTVLLCAAAVSRANTGAR